MTPTEELIVIEDIIKEIEALRNTHSPDGPLILRNHYNRILTTLDGLVLVLKVRAQAAEG